MCRGCREGANLQSLRVLIRFSVAMIAVPTVVMALSYAIILDSFFSFSSAADRVVYAGIAAITSVQFVIVAFIVYAFNERVDDQVSGGSGGKKDA